MPYKPALKCKNVLFFSIFLNKNIDKSSISLPYTNSMLQFTRKNKGYNEKGFEAFSAYDKKNRLVLLIGRLRRFCPWLASKHTIQEAR